MTLINTHNEIIFQLLKDQKSCRGFSDEALGLIAEVAALKKIKKGDYLWRANDSGDFAALIISGIFEVSKTVGRRKETCMGLFGLSDVIGLSAIYKKINYPGHCKALDHGCEVLKLYLRPLVNKSKDPVLEEISHWIRDRLLLHEQIVRDKVDFVCAGTIEDRLFEALCHLCRRFGDPTSRDTIDIPLKITRNQLARMIDSRVETVIRTINAWQKKDLIQWSQDHIKVKLFALEKHIQDQAEN